MVGSGCGSWMNGFLSWRVWIEGHGWRVAEDTGGLIKGNRIDIYMNSEDEAIRFGRREVRVVVRE